MIEFVTPPRAKWTWRISHGDAAEELQIGPATITVIRLNHEPRTFEWEVVVDDVGEAAGSVSALFGRSPETARSIARVRAEAVARALLGTP